MMAWLETTDFYTAPASTRFHGAEEGGLCAHSITVAKRLLEIADLWAPNQYSRDTLLTVALFHDLCKVFTYPVSTRNVKDKTTGRWKEVPYYGDRNAAFYGGVRCCEQPYGRFECSKCKHCLDLLRNAPAVLAAACGG